MNPLAPLRPSAARVLALACVLLALATLLGAAGAHALESRLTARQLDVFDTAVTYHFYHSLGLLGLGLLLQWRDSRGLRWAAALVVAGIALFCGSLYALTFGGPRWLGPVTPFGGIALMAGWLTAAFSIRGHSPASQ